MGPACPGRTRAQGPGPSWVKLGPGRKLDLVVKTYGLAIAGNLNHRKPLLLLASVLTAAKAKGVEQGTVAQAADAGSTYEAVPEPAAPEPAAKPGSEPAVPAQDHGQAAGAAVLYGALGRGDEESIVRRASHALLLLPPFETSDYYSTSGEERQGPRHRGSPAPPFSSLREPPGRWSW